MQSGLRAELCDSKSGLGKSVRNAKNLKYNYWIVVGDEEMNANNVTLESRTGEKSTISVADLITKLKEEVNDKK